MSSSVYSCRSLYLCSDLLFRGNRARNMFRLCVRDKIQHLQIPTVSRTTMLHSDEMKW